MDKHYFDHDQSVMPKILGIIQQNKNLALKFTVSKGDIHIFKNDKRVITLDQRVFNMLEANEILKLIAEKEERVNGQNIREG